MWFFFICRKINKYTQHTHIRSHSVKLFNLENIPNSFFFPFREMKIDVMCWVLSVGALCIHCIRVCIMTWLIHSKRQVIELFALLSCTFYFLFHIHGEHWRALNGFSIEHSMNTEYTKNKIIAIGGKQDCLFGVKLEQ